MSAVRLRYKPEQAEEQLHIDLSAAGIEHVRKHRYVPDRKFEADFAIIPARLLIEVQGGVYSRAAHGSVTGVLADIERLNLATLHGWWMLRYTPDQVASGEALSGIEAVLAAMP